MTPASVGRRRSGPWPIRILLFVLLNVALLSALNTLPVNSKVYLRNVLFSDIVTDSEITTEAALEARLARGFRRDAGSPQDYDPYLNAATVAALLQLKASGAGAQQLAQEIGVRIGPASRRSTCGLEKYADLHRAVEAGLGCCSDYAKIWLSYANRIGLPAREVQYFRHAGVEYLDAQLGQWIWFDALYRKSIARADGRPMNQFQARAAAGREPVTMVDHPPGVPRDALMDDLYAPFNLSALFYPQGNNLLEIHRFERPLAALRLSKSMRQLAGHLLGVRRDYLLYTSESYAFYFRLIKLLFVACVAGVLLLEAWLIRRLTTPRARG